MSGRNWSKQEVANKVDSEGGIIDALVWGLSAEDIADPELADAWRELETIELIIERVRSLLPEPGDDE